MKPGKVITIRVRPEDILTAFDIVKKTGALPENYSLATIVNSALSISFATLRGLNFVPTRDGFEYTETLTNWAAAKSSREAQLLATNTLNTAHAVALPPPLPQPQPPNERRELRIEELKVKKEFNRKKWTAKDERELTSLLGE